ncbi:MAG: galactosyltransferase-related protein [Maledivibacter sp.]|jgi:hypothetical protein|nr:galactosyltransferase-related protein [Maledivibacter sp.]
MNTLNNNISILINYKEGYHNDMNWWIVKNRYESILPDAQICVGHYKKGEYNKSSVINDAAKNATGDIFIIVDSNIIFNLRSITKGLTILDQYSFIIPYNNLIYLDYYSTQYFHSLSTDITINNAYFNGYKKSIGHTGDIFIVTRKNFEAIGGFDESITEWNEEDIDFANRLFNEFGDYHRLINESIWSLFYEKINYPSYAKGINVKKLLPANYSTEDISWDIRI